MDALVLSVQTVSLQLVNFQFSKNVKLNLHVSPPINKQYIKTGKITATYIHLLTRSASGALNRVCIRVTANKNSNICRRWHRVHPGWETFGIWTPKPIWTIPRVVYSSLIWVYSTLIYIYTIYSRLIWVYSSVIKKKQVHTYTIGGLNIDRLSCHNCRIRAQWHAAHLSCLIAIDVLPACLQPMQSKL